MFKKYPKLIKIAIPFAWVIAIVAPIYHAFFPWPPIQAEINKYPHDIAFFTSSHSTTTIPNNYGDDSKTETTESYVPITFEPLTSSTLTLTEYPDGKLAPSIEPGGLFTIIYSYIFLMVMTYVFWFRRKNELKSDK
ncbi:hypothetical protein [Vibrio marisflavi]|uniref:Uncharacterized protein n=1 Tax=Vibrio marisflavi CECT 7928 TaxID=634439 RepID=A0ABN8EB54_9VIBR|nr:hypothetical protein [Vibrio marisflavi]CAH0541816.1 hypothetical protein VMF7928_03861 [Vibrio marisflavi CECT 7928]